MCVCVPLGMAVTQKADIRWGNFRGKPHSYFYTLHSLPLCYEVLDHQNWGIYSATPMTPLARAQEAWVKAGLPFWGKCFCFCFDSKRLLLNKTYMHYEQEKAKVQNELLFSGISASVYNPIPHTHTTLFFVAFM